MATRYKATCVNGQGLASLETGQTYFVELSAKSKGNVNVFKDQNSPVAWGTFEQEDFELGEEVASDPRQEKATQEEIELNNFDFKDGSIDFEITPEGHEQIVFFKN